MPLPSVKIVTVKVYPRELAPPGISAPVWSTLLSVYKDLRMWVSETHKHIKSKGDPHALHLFESTWSVRQILDSPDIQPRLHMRDKINSFEAGYPALYMLLIYRRCIDVLKYENIKEIPSRPGFPQRQIDKFVRFVFNDSDNTRKGPPQHKRHGKRADPWSRSNPKEGSHDSSSKYQKPKQGGRSSYKTPPGHGTSAPPPGQDKSQPPPPRHDKSQPPRGNNNSHSTYTFVDTRTWKLYGALGVAKDSTHADIVAAWKAQMKKQHPDRIGRANVIDKTVWDDAVRAGRVLKHAENRKRYDEKGDEDVAWLKTHATNPYLVTLYTAPEEQFAG